MGIFADILSITPSDELKADVSDSYVTVEVKSGEIYGRNLRRTNNVTEPFELDHDVLLGLEGVEDEDLIESLAENVD